MASISLAVFAPTDEGYWNYSSGGTTIYTPPVLDQGGSMEDNGAQLSFVARRAGTYRLRVRGTTTNDCPHYELTATRGAVDTDQPPAIH